MRCRVLAPYVAMQGDSVVHQMKVGFVVDVDDSLVDELVRAKKVAPVAPKPEVKPEPKAAPKPKPVES